MATAWTVRVTPQVRGWLREIMKTDTKTAAAINAAVDELVARGPALGAPLVKSIESGDVDHLKELRPRSGQQVSIRILFVFDPLRRAVLLVGGNKAGDWSGWYDKTIPEAKIAYDIWLSQMM